MASRKEIQRRWEETNRELAQMHSVKEGGGIVDAEREQELLGELDAIEYEVGMAQQAAQPVVTHWSLTRDQLRRLVATGDVLRNVRADDWQAVRRLAETMQWPDDQEQAARLHHVLHAVQADEAKTPRD
jgi:hypothetical protein